MSFALNSKGLPDKCVSKQHVLDGGGIVLSINNVTPDISGNVSITIPTQADWNATSGTSQILNKPNLHNVATSGSYNDLSNRPSIPAAVSTYISQKWTSGNR